jgi:virginiamycin A acetyltransferase
MNGANHRMDGVSTFPFPIMGAPWSNQGDVIVGLPVPGDTIVATTCDWAIRRS